MPGTAAATTLEEALELAGAVGYPVLVKAAAGGGGRGIRAAGGPDELRAVFQRAAIEAAAAFGDGSLYVEKLVTPARHVEVQVLGDSRGNVVHVFERECSLQRRRQKLIEESPAPGMAAPTREAMTAAALTISRAVGYESAGTVEFLLGGDGRFSFIEMNTRIQVEHPVTEVVTGVDLVAEQLRIAGGLELAFRQDELVLRGAAIEVRVNAEDPEHDFRPSPGELAVFEPPAGDGVRVDTAAFPGYRIPPYYDSLVAKLIVHGETRDEALDRAERALAEFRVEGIATTIPFALELLRDPAVRAGAYDVEFVERRLAGSGRIPA
jgi:acetyl-CoA carboxylase biotin carboxylase subunit